jgi:hypothetical protein
MRLSASLLRLMAKSQSIAQSMVFYLSVTKEQNMN